MPSERRARCRPAGLPSGSAPRPRRSGGADADRSDRAAAEHREAGDRRASASAEELRGALLTARPALSAPPASPGGSGRGAGDDATAPRRRPDARVLAPVLRRFDPMLDQLRVRFPDAFSSSPTGPISPRTTIRAATVRESGIVLPPGAHEHAPPDRTVLASCAAYLRVPGSLEG